MSEKEEYKFPYSEKRIFSKFIALLSRSIIQAEGKYCINLQLETFAPNSYLQTAINAISDVVHALWTTIKVPKRSLRNQPITVTCEEIYFSHIAHLPSVLEDELNSLE